MIVNIEIYVLRPNDADVLEWVETRLGVLELVDQTEDIRIYHAPFQGAHVALTITPRMEGGDFTSLFFAGPRLPWRTDAECARDAARSQHAVVRCIPDGPHRDDEWLQISAEGERIAEWETDAKPAGGNL